MKISLMHSNLNRRFENTKIMTLAKEKMGRDTLMSPEKDQSTQSLNSLKDSIYGFNERMILFADFGCIEAHNIEELKREVIRKFLDALQDLCPIKLPSTTEEEFLKKNPTSISFFRDFLRLLEGHKFGAETAVVVIDWYPYSDHGYCKKFFFNAEEVKTLMSRFMETVTIEKLSDQFGNYFINGENYYHPGCVVNHFQRSKDNDSPDFDALYWCTTDSLDILTTARSRIEKYEMLLWHLRPDQMISFQHQEVLKFDKIMNDRNHAFTYLLQAGYLAIVQPKTHPVTYKKTNAEVRNIFTARCTESG